MCEFLSAWINRKTHKIVCYSLTSHSETERVAKFRGKFDVTNHCEFEWVGEREEDLTVRAEDAEEATRLKVELLTTFKKRTNLLAHIFDQAEYLDASGCTGLKELSAPVAEYLYASGCTGLKELSAPVAKTLYASGCTGLTKVTEIV